MLLKGVGKGVVALRLFCEVYNRYILPALRAMISEILIKKYSMTQCEVSKLLGITQPAINQYLSGRRGYKVVKILKTSSRISKLAEEVADRIVKEGSDPKEIAKMLCISCVMIRNDDELLKKLLSTINLGSNGLVLTDCLVYRMNSDYKECKQ